MGENGAQARSHPPGQGGGWDRKDVLCRGSDRLRQDAEPHELAHDVGVRPVLDDLAIHDAEDGHDGGFDRLPVGGTPIRSPLCVPVMRAIPETRACLQRGGRLGRCDDMN